MQRVEIVVKFKHLRCFVANSPVLLFTRFLRKFILSLSVRPLITSAATSVSNSVISFNLPIVLNCLGSAKNKRWSIWIHRSQRLNFFKFSFIHISSPSGENSISFPFCAAGKFKLQSHDKICQNFTCRTTLALLALKRCGEINRNAKGHCSAIRLI